MRFRLFALTPTRALLCLIFSACFASVAHSGNGEWTSAGPYGGGTLSKVEFNSSAASVVYASGAGGFYRSSDSGVTWVRSEVGLPQGLLAPRFTQNPSNGNQLVLWREPLLTNTSKRLFASLDGGVNFFRLAGTFSGASGPVVDVSINPSNSQQILVATQRGAWRSTDGGASFTAATGLPTGSDIFVSHIAIVGTRAYVGLFDFSVNRGRLYRSTDSGASYSQVTSFPETGSSIRELRIAPSNSNRVFVIRGTASQRSDNDAVSWSPIVVQPSESNALDIADSAGNTLFWTTATNVQTSTDAGNSQLTVSTVPGVLESVSSHPGAPQFQIASTGSRGLLRNFSVSAPLFLPSNSGFDSVLVRSIAVSNNANVIFAGQDSARERSHAAFRSNNAGATWAESGTTTPFNLLAVTTEKIIIDRTTANTSRTLYAVGKSVSGANASTGIFKGTNGGDLWAAADTGIPGRNMGSVLSLALDQRSCVSPPPSGPCTSGPLRTVYAGGSGRVNGATAGWAARMLYKSTDAGANWTAADNGLPVPIANETGSLEVSDIQIDPGNSQILYAGLTFTGPDNYVGGMVPGVYRSLDGGATWAAFNTGLPLQVGTILPANVAAIAIDPFNPNQVYAAVSFGFFQIGTPTAGIYKSTAGGSWVNVSNGVVGANVLALIADKDQAGVLYAGTSGDFSNPGGVFKTSNGGGIWLSISRGLPATAAASLAQDPLNGAQIFAGTNNGVWALTQVPDTDGDGASTSIENAAPGAGGDGNNDGTPDSTQTAVASILSAIDFPFAARTAQRGRTNYITNDTDAALAAGARAANGDDCDQVIDAYGIDPRIYPPDSGGFTFNDFGLINLELENCASAILTVKFHDANFDTQNWRWRNYGPSTPGDVDTLLWYTFSNAVLINPTTWRMTINANALGSWRSGGNRILFRGGPGKDANLLLKDGFE